MGTFPFGTATAPAPPGTLLPPGWNNQWKKAKALAQTGTGVARIAAMGESWVAGQSTGTVTDCLLYGWVGRLDSMLAGTASVGGTTPAGLGGYAEGYTIAAAAPGNLNSPSSPYGNSSLPAFVTSDGGVSQLWTPSSNGSTWVTIAAPVHPVTGANPTSMDILTVDFNTNSWQYSVDGGGAVTVTPPAGTPPTGVNATVGAGIMRRTSITFAGNTTHTVAVQQNAANALAFNGHITYYGTTGLGIFRGPLPGWKATDFATGGGTTASSTGGNSLTPDHILPYSGVTPTSPNGIVNNNIYASCANGFPFNGVDLAIIQIGGNDCTQFGSPDLMRKAVTRFINAFRRANPLTATTPGCSILFVGESYFSPYSDDSNAAPTANFEWQRYKAILFELSQMYGCGWLDLQQVFGETPVARGLTINGGAHPTQNGAGAGGGDGHLLIAQSIYSLL